MHEASDSQRLRPNHAMLLRMLSICIRNYLNSAMRYTFLILDTCHPYILHLSEQGCDDPWLFFRNQKSVREQKILGNSATDYDCITTPCEFITQFPSMFNSIRP
jgi:hypothetical protein